MADNQNKPKGKSAKMPTGVVFDVRRPGKTPAPPTSRPVIVGHKPEAQAAQTAVSGIGEASPLPARRKIQIMPSGDLSVVESKPAGGEEMPAGQAPEQNTDTHVAVPEKDKEALVTAVMDAVAGPLDFSEPEPKPDEEPGAVSDIETEDRPMLLAKSKVITLLSEGQTDEPDSTAKESSISEGSEENESKEDSSGQDAGEAANEQDSENKAEQPAGGTEQTELSTTEETAVTSEESPGAAVEGAGQGEQKEEEQKPEPHIEPLFDEHGAIVSRHSHRRRGHGLKVFALLLVALILAAAILDILLDLEILNLDGVPHTDFL